MPFILRISWKIAGGFDGKRSWQFSLMPGMQTDAGRREKHMKKSSFRFGLPGLQLIHVFVNKELIANDIQTFSEKVVSWYLLRKKR